MKIKYDDIVDYQKIDLVYHKICMATKHRKKLVYFEFSKFANFMYIYQCLKNRIYVHGKYNIFLIKIPKYRIIMSENLFDKIVNHLVSLFILFPVIEPKLIDSNVATRVGMGLDKGIFLTKKYLNLIRNDIDEYYVLKCDITKYFYNIDHEILLNKLKKIINDDEIMAILTSIITSTNAKYVNDEINNQIENEIKRLQSNVNNLNEKIVNKLKKIPLYNNGKGLPIGNMTSQILAIFYLNDLDHFIKEKLHIKYYIRYMDDFLLFHHDKEYLKYCQKEIAKELNKIKLVLNKKTTISKVTDNFTFLGYRFVIKNKRVNLLPGKVMCQKLRKRYKKEGEIILKKYNGYLKRCKSRRFYNL